MCKVIFDKLISLILLVLTFPFLIIIIALSAYSTKSTGLFFQKRIGQYGEPFIIYKVRTMHNGSVTKIGKVLRNLKLDELPQIINILKGDMSIVGPRPDVAGYYDKLAGTDRELLKLKPGITSLAAIKYRNEDSILNSSSDPKKLNDEIIFPDKVKMNLEYMEKQSFRDDLKIIFLTIRSFF